MATEAEIKTIVTASISDFEAKMRKATAAMQSAEKSFKNSSQRMNSSFSTIQNGVKGFIAAITVREVANFTKHLIDVAGAMKDLEDQTGVSASFFSAMEAEVENAGSSLEAFAGAINKLNISVADAFSGEKSAIDKFKKLGVSLDELKGKSPQQQLIIVSNAIAQLSTRGQQAAAATDLMGKGAASLIPVLSKGGDAMQKLADESDRLNTSLSPQTVDRLDRLGDGINTAAIAVRNFAAENLVGLLNRIEIGYLRVAQALIVLNRQTGYFDKDVADEALMESQRQIDAIKNPPAIQPPGATTGGERELFNTKSIEDAAKGAEKLHEAIMKIHAEASRDNFVSGMTDAEKRMAELDFQVRDLERQYKSKVTDVDRKAIEATKEMYKALDEYKKKQEETKRFTDELGGSFRDAFTEGMLGARKFGDVLSSLGQRISQIFFNKLVGDPISKFFNDAAGSIFGGAGGGGGIGGFLGGLLPTFSFATGTSNVPRDGLAMLHKGEQVVTRSQVDAQARRAEGGSGSAGNTYYIDARGADAGAVSRINQSLLALAGPGVIERRVINAQKRGEI